MDQSPVSFCPKVPEGSVVLGYNHKGNVPHQFLDCIIKLQAARMGVNTVISERTFFLANGRNKVVKQFLETKGDWLLFVDDDICFTPDDIVRLYAFADKEKAPIVAGLYFGRLDGIADNKILPVWLMKAEGQQFASLERLEGKGLQQVDVVGMGFTMIHREVLERMFDFAPKNDDWIWFGHDLRNGRRIGEDATFCMRAGALGYPIYGCPEVILPHLKEHLYTAQMFLDQKDVFKPL